MVEHPLQGCRTEPLGSYLKALGILRLIGEQKDPDSRGHWRGDEFVLTTKLDREELKVFFLDKYVPTPVVSPWNNGSGFKEEKNPKAVAALRLVANATMPRLAPYREAIEVGRQIHADMISGGWEKARTVAACRSRLPDPALAWVDTAVVLASAGEVFPPLLGTGGNDGRFDFSVAFMSRLADVFGMRVGRGSPDRSQSALWLEDALFGEPTALLCETAGQFMPGAVGGANSAPTGSAPSMVNPWDWVLLVEGAVAFAGGVARRMNTTSPGRAAIPFTAEASAVGYGSSAAAEGTRGEVWAPLWSQPASAAEVRRLLEEGRVTWRGQQARSALDFARGAADLGTDRGVRGFVRFGLLERNGQATAAVRLSVVSTRAHPAVRLTAALDPWISRVRRSDMRPQAVGSGLGAVDRALFRTTQSGAQRDLQRLLASLADLEEVVGRAKGFRARTGIPPLTGIRSRDWFAALDDGTDEFRLAAAWASLRDESGANLRGMLRPVQVGNAGLEWTDGPELVAGLGRLPLDRVLADAHVRRVIDVVRNASGAESELVGVQTAYRYAHRVPPATIARFLRGELDESRLSELFRGLLLVDWSWSPQSLAGSAGHAAPVGFMSPAFALLAPFFHGRPLQAGGNPDVRLVPEEAWPALLATGQVEQVVRAALRRLRVARLQPAFGDLDADRIAATAPTGSRLSAALLAQIPDRDATRSLATVTISNQ